MTKIKNSNSENKSGKCLWHHFSILQQKRKSRDVKVLCLIGAEHLGFCVDMLGRHTEHQTSYFVAANRDQWMLQVKVSLVQFSPCNVSTLTGKHVFRTMVCKLQSSSVQFVYCKHFHWNTTCSELEFSSVHVAWTKLSQNKLQLREGSNSIKVSNLQRAFQ